MMYVQEGVIQARTSQWGNTSNRFRQSKQKSGYLLPQATSLFFNKFHRIVLHLRALLSNPTTTAIVKYIQARDFAFFTFEFFTGQRASDLGKLKTVDILENPDGKSLLIHQRVGNSLRGGLSRPIPVRPLENPAIFRWTTLNSTVHFARQCKSVWLKDSSFEQRRSTPQCPVLHSWYPQLKLDWLHI